MQKLGVYLSQDSFDVDKDLLQLEPSFANVFAFITVIKSN